jgi:hypothetical protein
MDQRSIVLYLARKSLSAIQSDEDLRATLGPDAMSDPSVTRFLREATFPPPNPLVTFSEEEPGSDDSDGAILLALTEQPFASIRQLSGLIHRSRSTIHPISWVPQTSSSTSPASSDDSSKVESG